MPDRPLDPWHFIDHFPSDCSAEVSRGGNSEPCDKPAYAVAVGDMGPHWPVCIHHARGRQLVPLRAVLAHGNEQMVRHAEL
jgi:hypothetical protein